MNWIWRKFMLLIPRDIQYFFPLTHPGFRSREFFVLKFNPFLHRKFILFAFLKLNLLNPLYASKQICHPYRLLYYTS